MERYEQTSAPSSYPVTLDEAKSHCCVYGEPENTYLTALIGKATRYFERTTERQLLTATWKLRMDCFPDEIELRICPVASVSSIAYIDLNGTSQTLSSAYYQTDLEAPDTPGRIRPAYGCTWPDTRSETYNAVTVTFTCGYGAASDVPLGAKHSILLLTAWWYEMREPVNVGNIVNALPFSLNALIANESWGSYA